MPQPEQHRAAESPDGNAARQTNNSAAADSCSPERDAQPSPACCEGAAPAPEQPSGADIRCGVMSEAPQLPGGARVFRCANFGLYLGCAVLIIASVSYYLSAHGSENHPLQNIAALAGCAAAVLWAAWFCTISYRIDEHGISERKLSGRRRLAWADLRSWEVHYSADCEQATCRLRFEGREGTPAIELSSELLELEALENLARELQGTDTV